MKPKWEWNHNSDNGKWSVNNGLTLRTATVANDLYWARNILTDRIQGPTSTATIQLDYATMRDGDRAGLALLRDLSAWSASNETAAPHGCDGQRLDHGQQLEHHRLRHRHRHRHRSRERQRHGRSHLAARGRRHPPRRLPSGNLLHSTDGTNFTRLGPAFTMGDTWQFFMGCRFTLTNYATRTLGCSVRIARFALTTPRAQQRPSPRI